MSKGTSALAIIVGRMGASLHVKKINDNVSVGEISLAVTHGYGDKQTTSWFNVKVWNKKTIEILTDYTDRGSRIQVVGELKIRKYQKDGQDRYITEIEVGYSGTVEILDGVKEDTPGSGTRAVDTNKLPAPPFDEDLDDDVPF